ncbi:fungal Zn binuclear cluster domain-containing protein [Colletotrichum scovillei]|uniref:Fungal Zn binuclear cluster domain-containing protein n=2 Tax=Colletotrichum acutatum species complex TaxID=2707335 RepID=A0A9P7R102_9PEZI|nr:fungal Zn binuclear cluster domain-containing protein [Colletotrichum scovillei]KAF4777187.1 fungal Zn binuclear cluster domain-containing protein [Colletotrichum scovillei]KAG7047597.1 fungal Zn binuclear cluster domain-containing protein [Colletotrichum scovillei]KAG7059908.1 fungal Zn binuclear cluster domain-containing protein [Colletotrichum scovillei]KAG7067362.1 fungal Zn binuclear cluster domain-containing protein [Colletotrichum scovillei]
MEKRTRRLGHKKSRNGCQRCKARRVKCDEERPCQKCVAHGVHCSLLDRPASVTAPLTPPAAAKLAQHEQRYAPIQQAAPAVTTSSNSSSKLSSHGMQEAASEAGLTPNTAVSSTSPYPGGEAAPDPRNPATDPWDLSEDWLQSLRLMHHYSTSTRHVLPKDACTEELWKTAIPEMACSHKFLMHGLLALSALHYAHVHPQQRKKYDIISVNHQNEALRFFALRLNDINKDNCEAYFFLATLIFIVSICSVAHSESFGRSIALSDVSQSFSLLHGVKGILDFQPIEAWRQRGGPLDGLLRPPVLTQGGWVSTSAFQKRLDAITSLAREVPASFTDVINPQSVCVLALEGLRRAHQMSRGEGEKPGGVWGWSATLPAMFIDMVASGHPTALVILAHYAALAKPCEKADWLCDGWSGAVMRLIERTLEDEWKPWIEWPKRSVFERIDVDDMEV